MFAFILSKIKSWIPLAIIITALSGLVYLAVQQEIRSSANDPQIQLAENLASLLGKGQPVQSIFLPDHQLDISKGLDPYAIVYDESGNPVGSSGLLDGKIPQVPKGVLDYVKKYGEDTVTWQPKAEVRSAIVVMGYKSANGSGYVLVGKSLRETEKRVSRLTIMVGLVWFITLVVSLAAIVMLGA